MDVLNLQMNNKLEIIPTQTYQWNPDWAHNIAHTDINLVLSELSVIEETRGKITPQLVIESAKNKKSVLHDYFEWDDSKAAQSWRVRQASSLLNNIKVNVVKDGETKQLNVYSFSKKVFGSNSETPYIKFDMLKTTNISFNVEICIIDLRRVKNRLINLQYESAIAYIDKAISELQKEQPEKITIDNLLGNACNGSGG